MSRAWLNHRLAPLASTFAHRCVRGLALGMLALAGLPACDRGQDPNAAALAEVQRQMIAVHAGGAKLAAPGLRAQTYEQAVSALTPVAAAGNPTQQAAANLLIGRARLGQASLAASDVAEMERRAVDALARIRSNLDFVLRRRAEAAALESYDPAQERTGTAEQMEAARVGLDKAQQEAQQITENIETLQTQLDAAQSEASRLRQQAGQRRAQAIDASATRSAELVEEAYAIQRRADAADAKAADLQAQIESLMPLVEELQEEIEGYRAQLDLLSQSRDRLEEREEEARARASALRAEVEEALSAVDVAVEDLESMRANRIEPKHEDAIDAAEGAISSLRRAQGGGDVAGAIAVGEATQRLGEILAARARGLERMADLYRRLTQLAPGRGYDQALSEAQRAADEARAAAAGAFADARDAYARARPRDPELRDRMDRLQQSLDQTVRRLGGEGSPEAAPQTTPEGRSPAQGAAPPAPDSATPRP